MTILYVHNIKGLVRYRPIDDRSRNQPTQRQGVRLKHGSNRANYFLGQGFDLTFIQKIFREKKK